MRQVEIETKTCGWCDGRGERREAISYYDVEWMTCFACKGKGERVVSTKYIDGPQPFPLAKD